VRYKKKIHTNRLRAGARARAASFDVTPRRRVPRRGQRGRPPLLPRARGPLRRPSVVARGPSAPTADVAPRGSPAPPSVANGSRRRPHRGAHNHSDQRPPPPPRAAAAPARASTQKRRTEPRPDGAARAARQRPRRAARAGARAPRGRTGGALVGPPPGAPRRPPVPPTPPTAPAGAHRRPVPARARAAPPTKRHRGRAVDHALLRARTAAPRCHVPTVSATSQYRRGCPRACHPWQSSTLSCPVTHPPRCPAARHSRAGPGLARRWCCVDFEMAQRGYRLARMPALPRPRAHAAHPVGRPQHRCNGGRGRL